jgi:hypothetical protein
MTGPDDATASGDYAGTGGGNDAAEIAAFLAAEAVANDYHGERLADVVVD